MNNQQFPREKWQKVVWANIVLRLILGPVMFISVWFSSFFTFWLDAADGEFFRRAGYSRNRYNLFDKALDYYWYVFVMVYILNYNVPSKRIFLILFSFRSLGQMFYFFTGNELCFFFFPNIFEIFFYFYLITLLFPRLRPFLYFPQSIYPLAVMTLLVSTREYLLHIKKVNLSRFYTGKTTYWIDDEPVEERKSISLPSEPLKL